MVVTCTHWGSISVLNTLLLVAFLYGTHSQDNCHRHRLCGFLPKGRVLRAGCRGSCDAAVSRRIIVSG